MFVNEFFIGWKAVTGTSSVPCRSDLRLWFHKAIACCTGSKLTLALCKILVVCRFMPTINSIVFINIQHSAVNFTSISTTQWGLSYLRIERIIEHQSFPPAVVGVNSVCFTKLWRVQRQEFCNLLLCNPQEILRNGLHIVVPKTTGMSSMQF